MSYYVDLFSPDTYQTFSQSDRTISGFRERQLKLADRIIPGNRFICYVTKLSAWVGVLEVISGPFVDHTPIWGDPDPFVVRFKVRPLVWLGREFAVPIHDQALWDNLTFTSGLPQNSSSWTGAVRGSLRRLADEDGSLIESLLMQQANGPNPVIRNIDETEWRRLRGHVVQTTHGHQIVSIPEPSVDESDAEEVPVELRESIVVQALLGVIGTRMGLKIWIPRSDRQRVVASSNGNPIDLIEILPLNYDETTLKTIEQIDVLWLKGRSIVRAFEVEHTTSIYSGILRMADLMALQPNMDINLHIVAPEHRRTKVFDEIRRPVFSYMERRPLGESCTYISYASVREIAALPHLNRMSSGVIDDYAEEVE